MEKVCMECAKPLTPRVVETEHGPVTYWECGKHGLMYYQEGRHE